MQSERGTVAFVSRDDHTPPEFTASWGALLHRMPSVTPMPCFGNDVADNRNRAVQHMVGDWIWFIDTDHLFQPDVVTRLLSHGVEAVQALCLSRHMPHEPILYERSATKREPRVSGRPRLVFAKSLGAGGTLFRRSVFEKIPPPWFEGIIGKEDTTFAKKLADAKVQLYTDTTTMTGHLGTFSVWPRYDEQTGQWWIMYRDSNGRCAKVVPLADGEVP